MVENSGRLCMLAEFAASTRPARYVHLVRFEHRRTTWAESSPINVRPGSVAPAAARRRVRWPSWWRDQHPRSASDCSERAHGCLSQCRLPKPWPQRAPVPRTAMFGFPDPSVIMSRIIGRNASRTGRFAQAHALRYALSAACCLSSPIAPQDAGYDSPARYLKANDFRMLHRANKSAGGLRLPRWDSSLLRGIPGFPRQAGLLEPLSRLIRLVAVVKRVFCRCTEIR